MTSLSVIVPCRNERDRLPAFIAMIEAQSTKPDEVVLVDGMSDDGSRDWLVEAASTRPWLRVVDNPGRIIPCALNIGLRASSGDIVARMDTHADYAPSYLKRASRFLDDHRGVDAVGGAMTTAGLGVWGRAIAATLRRPFGLGGARHRVGGASGPVEHVFSGCYQRAALERIGGWDERLLANEDFEADTRMRERGMTVWLEPTIESTWYVRESPGRLAGQMYRYGYYKAATVALHPASLRARQSAPPILVCALAAALLSRRRLPLLLAGGYLGAAAALGARAAHADHASVARGSFVPPIVHLSWGSGFVVGSLRVRRTLKNRG